MAQIRSIPTELAFWSLRFNKVKELQMLVSLKGLGTGHFHESELDQMFHGSPVKTRSTFNRQLKSLLKLRWIYKSASTGYYNIRSFSKICVLVGLSYRNKIRINPLLNLDSVAKFRAFIFAGYLVSRVSKAKYFFTSKYAPLDALNSGGAFLSKDRGVKHRRWGISMDKIRSAIGYTRQYMNRMKREAMKYGFIVCLPIYVKTGSGMRRINDEIRGFVESRFINKKSVSQKGGSRRGGGVDVKLYRKNKGLSLK